LRPEESRAKWRKGYISMDYHVACKQRYWERVSVSSCAFPQTIARPTKTATA
jgi:hypothetical protein